MIYTSINLIFSLPNLSEAQFDLKTFGFSYNVELRERGATPEAHAEIPSSLIGVEILDLRKNLREKFGSVRPSSPKSS